MPYPKPKQVWANMVRRCTDPSDSSFRHYGGRGIKVCKKWLEYSEFKKWFDATYVEGLSIDRINNDKGYKPSNCRWATKSQQAKNKRFTEKWRQALVVGRVKRTARLLDEAKSATKKCGTCQKFKYRRYFYHKPTAVDKTSTECKFCQKNRAKSYYRRKNGKNQ